jgi:hypothetical protein
LISPAYVAGGPELESENLLRSPGIDSQAGGQVRQTLF